MRATAFVMAMLVWFGWVMGLTGVGFVLALCVLALFLVVHRPPAPVSRPVEPAQDRGRSRWVIGFGLPIGPFFAGIYRRLGK